jgi:tetratricopeptide (TPR) repeat protein
MRRKYIEVRQDKLAWKVMEIIVAPLIIAIVSILITHYLTKNTTENKIVEALSERYTSVDKEMSYEQALVVIDKDIEVLKLNNNTLQVEKAILQDEVSSLQNELAEVRSAFAYSNERSDKIARAESYAILADYETAIPILNSVAEKTEDVIALLKDYVVKFEASIITRAELLAENGNHNEAETLIDNALKILPDSRALIDKKETIKPKYLVETVECYKAKDLFRLDSRDTIKMAGKSYKYAIYSYLTDAVASMFNSSYSANAYYNLDGRYSKLKGTIGHIDFSGSGMIGESDGGQVYSATITIWGDNKEIYSVDLSSNTIPVDFDVSIVGVTVLEFEIECSGNSRVGIGEVLIF